MNQLLHRLGFSLNQISGIQILLQLNNICYYSLGFERRIVQFLTVNVQVYENMQINYYMSN
jgi:hypothetical protein